MVKKIPSNRKKSKIETQTKEKKTETSILSTLKHDKQHLYTVKVYDIEE